MIANYFESLGLPLEPIEPAVLDRVYKHLKQEWFLRQYVPEHAVEARDRLSQLEEAYRALRDPRRQAALLRDLRYRLRAKERAAQDPTLSGWRPPPEEPEEGPRAVPRAQLVQKLLRVTELIVLRSRRPLGADEKTTLVRIAFRMGLDYPDAQQIVDQIAERVVPSRRASIP